MKLVVVPSGCTNNRATATGRSNERGFRGGGGGRFVPARAGAKSNGFVGGFSADTVLGPGSNCTVGALHDTWLAVKALRDGCIDLTLARKAWSEAKHRTRHAGKPNGKVTGDRVTVLRSSGLRDCPGSK